MRIIRCDTVIVVAFLFAAAAALTARAGERKDIGGFDIDKVREYVGSRTIPIADTNVKTAQGSEPVERNYMLIVLRVIGSLAIIIVLVIGASWCIRKTGLAGASRAGRGGSMDILETLPLGQNRAVVLMRVMDTVYLCGQTASTISLLDKIEGRQAVELLASGKGPSAVVQFKEAFNRYISKVKA